MANHADEQLHDDGTQSGAAEPSSKPSSREQANAEESIGWVESEEQAEAGEELEEEEEFGGGPLETVAGDEKEAAEAEISFDEILRERFGVAPTRRGRTTRHRSRPRRRHGPRSDGDTG